MKKNKINLGTSTIKELDEFCKRSNMYIETKANKKPKVLGYVWR